MSVMCVGITNGGLGLIADFGRLPVIAESIGDLKLTIGGDLVLDERRGNWIFVQLRRRQDLSIVWMSRINHKELVGLPELKWNEDQK